MGTTPLKPEFAPLGPATQKLLPSPKLLWSAGAIPYWLVSASWYIFRNFVN